VRAAQAAKVVGELDLDFDRAGVCLACLSFVAFPLDTGDERAARGQARRLTPVLWDEGLELPAMLALETAKRDGVPHAREALDDARLHGARSVVVGAIVWRLAEQMAEDIRARRAERQCDPAFPNSATVAIPS
jgi:hypothetical protein